MKELVERNAAYKKSLEYCEETCNDVDMYFDTAKHAILLSLDFTKEQVDVLNQLLDVLNKDVKDNGTRKLRKVFVDYILENTEG